MHPGQASPSPGGSLRFSNNEVANAFDAEHADSPLHLRTMPSARWENPLSGLRFVVGQTLQELLCLSRKASATFSRTYDQTRPHACTTELGVPVLLLSSEPQGHPFFRCVPPPMVSGDPCRVQSHLYSAKERERDLPQHVPTFVSHS